MLHSRELNRLRMIEIRKGRSLTQEALARLVKRNRVSISNIERGSLKPSYELVYAIADALGVKADELFKVTSSNLEDLPLAEEEKKLLECFRAMSPTTRSIILTFLLGLSRSDVADIQDAVKTVRRASGRGD